MRVRFQFHRLPTSKRFWNKAQGRPALWLCGPTLGRRPKRFFNLKEVAACWSNRSHNLFEVANSAGCVPRVGSLRIEPTLGFAAQPLRGWRRILCEPCRSIDWMLRARLKTGIIFAQLLA